MTDYFGGQTNYSYDALGRLTSLSNPFGEVTTFQYDANSRLIRKNRDYSTYGALMTETSNYEIVYPLVREVNLIGRI